LPVGFLPDVDFEQNSLAIAQNSTLYVFSDGAYEIQQPNGNIWGLEAFIHVLRECNQVDIYPLNQVLHQITQLNAQETFDDDLSLLKVTFG